MVVYIAGKVTGLPYDEVVAKFSKAEAKLKAKGCEVVNPIKLCPKDMDWDKCMEICIDALENCDYIYLLPDWKDSRGARREFDYARLSGILEYVLPTLGKR